MIRGLPKTWDERDFRKWLDTLVVARSSCKKKKNWPYGFITFGYLDDRLHATKTLDGCILGGRPVTVHDAVNKKPGDNSRDNNNNNNSGKTREELIVAAADRGARRDVRDADAAVDIATAGSDANGGRECERSGRHTPE